MLYFGCRCFIVVLILVADLQICHGEWALCFVLLQQLVFKITFFRLTVDVVSVFLILKISTFERFFYSTLFLMFYR